MPRLPAPGRLTEVVSVGFLWYKAATLLINALAFTPLRPRCADLRRVSVLVPVRNEARNLPLTLPALLTQGAAEVIVLDDGSSDESYALACQMCRGVSGARVVRGSPLTPGWHGKPHACAQLARHASAEVLVFTDADVLWQPGALSAVVAELQRSGAGLLSVWPRQHAATLGERLLTPLVDDVLLGLFPAPLTRWPFAAMSAANGQVMAFTHAAYHKVGGHNLVKSEVLEDVVFARRLKARGARVAVALGGNLISVRMYRSYPESVRGFAKSLPSAHGHSKVLLAASWLWHLAVYTWPWLSGKYGTGLLGVLTRLAVSLKAGRRSPSDFLEVLLTPALPLVSLPVYLLALSGRYRWKEREYQR